MTKEICKNCGHPKEKHLIGVHNLNHFARWDECKEEIKQDKATFQCICNNYVEDKRR